MSTVRDLELVARDLGLKPWQTKMVLDYYKELGDQEEAIRMANDFAADNRGEKNQLRMEVE